jgi:hypothetical protein
MPEEIARIEDSGEQKSISPGTIGFLQEGTGNG